VSTFFPKPHRNFLKPQLQNTLINIIFVISSKNWPESIPNMLYLKLKCLTFRKFEGWDGGEGGGKINITFVISSKIWPDSITNMLYLKFLTPTGYEGYGEGGGEINVIFVISSKKWPESIPNMSFWKFLPPESIKGQMGVRANLYYIRKQQKLV